MSSDVVERNLSSYHIIAQLLADSDLVSRQECKLCVIFQFSITHPRFPNRCSAMRNVIYFRRSPFSLLFAFLQYSFMLLLLFVGEVILSTVVFVFPHSFTHFLKEGLSKDPIIKYREDTNLQNLIDVIQTEFKCCGVSDKGYKDWYAVWPFSLIYFVFDLEFNPLRSTFRRDKFIAHTIHT